MAAHPRPCVDCRFFNDDHGRFCMNPKVDEPDPVDGFKHKTCAQARKGVYGCGERGVYFERRKSLLQKIKDAFTHDGF